MEQDAENDVNSLSPESSSQSRVLRTAGIYFFIKHPFNQSAHHFNPRNDSIIVEHPLFTSMSSEIGKTLSLISSMCLPPYQAANADNHLSFLAMQSGVL